MVGSSRWVPLVTTAAVAAALTGAAVFTVDQAGCDDPGTWVIRGGTVELVGGCVDREDLPVAPAPDDLGPAAPAVRLGD